VEYKNLSKIKILLKIKSWKTFKNINIPTNKKLEKKQLGINLRDFYWDENNSYLIFNDAPYYANWLNKDEGPPWQHMPIK
jgi:selenocysteine-specific translation elongation factor